MLVDVNRPAVFPEKIHFLLSPLQDFKFFWPCTREDQTKHKKSLNPSLFDHFPGARIKRNLLKQKQNSLGLKSWRPCARFWAEQGVYRWRKTIRFDLVCSKKLLLEMEQSDDQIMSLWKSLFLLAPLHHSASNTMQWPLNCMRWMHIFCFTAFISTSYIFLKRWNIQIHHMFE